MKRLALAAAAAATSTAAGAFTPATNPTVPVFEEGGSVTFQIPEGPAAGTINYTTNGSTTENDATAFAFDLPTNFTVLATNVSEILLPEDGDFEEVGTVTDQVWQDTNDGSLVFATRIALEPEFDDVSGTFEYEGELNDVFRSGFAGRDVAVAYVIATSADEGFSKFARTSESLLGVTGTANADADTVAMFGDFNGEEGVVFSAWLLVKTDAPDFALIDDALGLFQAGEEDQEPFLFSTAGYAPVPVPAALPLLAGALVGLGVAARRRA